MTSAPARRCSASPARPVTRTTPPRRRKRSRRTGAETLAAKSWQPLLNAGAEGARGMLTAIASSMITVAGVAFSITIVTLSLASTQYTPRILRNFMRDRANQFVLGVFVAIFTYCLVVLRTIRGGSEHDGAGFVPLLAVAFALLLALVSIGFLIFFIHHVAASIQASSILRAIADETQCAIEALFPEELGETLEDAPAAELPDAREGCQLPRRRPATSSTSLPTGCSDLPKSTTPYCGWSSILASSCPRARLSPSRIARSTTPGSRRCVRSLPLVTFARRSKTQASAFARSWTSRSRHSRPA